MPQHFVFYCSPSNISDFLKFVEAMDLLYYVKKTETSDYTVFVLKKEQDNIPDSTFTVNSKETTHAKTH
ncbi:MAG: hypothetical protein K2X29_05390 [Candidatus Obscuribacterales bacterium]|nr:hypothetical protein [Candidatus Obscuribacterales bacterium]